MKKFIASQNGAVTSYLLYVMIVVFVLLPLGAFIMEKYVMENRAAVIRDSIDISNIATYTAIVASQAGEVNIDIDDEKALDVFTELLKKNLKLNDDMMPREDSIADGRVTVESFNIYVSDFPVTCPDGATFSGPAICTRTIIPVKPSFFRELILDALGEEYVNIHLHVDSTIPVNN